MNHVHLILLFMVSFGSSAENGQNIGREFYSWHQKFVDVIDSENWSALQQLSSLPLLVRGELDGEGECLIDEKQFSERMKTLMDQPALINVDDEFVEGNVRGMIMTGMPTEESIEQSQVRIQDLRFEKVDGQWRWVKIYLNLEALESMGCTAKKS